MLNRKSESKYIAENGSYDRGDTVDRILGLTTIEGDRCFVVEWNKRGNGDLPQPSIVSIDQEFRWKNPEMLIDYFIPEMISDMPTLNPVEKGRQITGRQCKFVQGDEAKPFWTEQGSRDSSVRSDSGSIAKNSNAGDKMKNTQAKHLSRQPIIVTIKEEPISPLQQKCPSPKKPPTAAKTQNIRNRFKAEPSGKAVTQLPENKKGTAKSRSKSPTLPSSTTLISKSTTSPIPNNLLETLEFRDYNFEFDPPIKPE